MNFHRNWPLLLALIPAFASAQTGPAPLFKRASRDGRAIEHRIDLASVHKTWAYKTFWTSTQDARTHAPVTVTLPFWPRLLSDPVGALTFKPVPWSQKYVVDCTGRRIGTRFIQSSDPKEAAAAVTVKDMVWQDLKGLPALHTALCD